MDGIEWHKWRKEGIGSSDAPVVMGVSPWSTPYKLWELKIGVVKESETGNWATNRGNKMEPIARADYELKYGRDMPARLCEHATIPWLHASLDGFSADSKIILEIKCPGAEDHAKAVAGTVPEKYIPQIQHQLLVTGADVCHYYSFDGERGVLVEVKPDVEYCKKLFLAEQAFWDLVVNKEPPELCDRDYKKVKGIEVDRLATAWKEAKDVFDKSKDLLERARDDFLKAIDIKKNRRVLVGTVRVADLPVIGRVDYKKIPELKGVDLNKYRGKPTTQTRMTIVAGETEGEFVL